MASLNSTAVAIDEDVARRDITKINNANSYLQQSKKTIQQLITVAEGMKGSTGTAIAEKANELLARVNALSANLEASAALINSTIKRYQQTDSDLAKYIRG